MNSIYINLFIAGFTFVVSAILITYIAVRHNIFKRPTNKKLEVTSFIDDMKNKNCEGV